MPYVSQSRRAELDAGQPPATPGDLAYVVTRAVDRYLNRAGAVRFVDLAETVGVLESAKAELYRRVVAVYEDGKLADHGDVYTVNP